MPLTHRKYKKAAQKRLNTTNDASQNAEPILEDAALLEKIDAMKRKYPSSANRDFISAGLRETFPSRHQWIMTTHPTSTDINKKYERLLDYNGDMVRFIL